MATPAVFFMDLRLRLNKKRCVSKWNLQSFSNLVPDKLIDSTLSCRSVNDTAYQYKIIFSYLLPCHLYDANLPGRLEFSE
ncbi:hypothetical protein [Prevotella nigrescens]|uniref:hypothetical protein n=1 Tax=Prevotella nigrescens TaxID=28133 RepID=UPI00242BF6CE|nr:hypothetical protein [Prevotella nigrescens]